VERDRTVKRGQYRDKWWRETGQDRETGQGRETGQYRETRRWRETGQYRDKWWRETGQYRDKAVERETVKGGWTCSTSDHLVVALLLPPHLLQGLEVGGAGGPQHVLHGAHLLTQPLQLGLRVALRHHTLHTHTHTHASTHKMTRSGQFAGHMMSVDRVLSAAALTFSSAPSLE